MSTPAVIISGATSSIAHFLVPRLVATGYHVHALSRGTAPASGKVSWHQIQADGLHPALPKFEAPVALIHLAPLWTASELLSICAVCGVDRVIAFGSTSVFTKKNSSTPQEKVTAERLAQAEIALQKGCEKLGVRWVLLRPTLVYAPGMDKNLSRISALVRRFRLLPLIPPATGLRQPVHAEDLAVACTEILRLGAFNNRAYNVSGGETLTYREMVERLFVAAHVKPRVLWVPQSLARLAITTAQRISLLKDVSVDMLDRINLDLTFDHSAARHDFGFSPRKFSYDAPAMEARRQN